MCHRTRIGEGGLLRGHRCVQTLYEKAFLEATEERQASEEMVWTTEVNFQMQSIMNGSDSLKE